ncbi:MAG: hypothetical protein LBT81_04425 [Helicobacteraceae bacterium]|nr:hypothetical protein [Helicobacteraceae bacterium]
MIAEVLNAFGYVPPVTDYIPGYGERPPGLNGLTDWLGHKFVEIYINPYLSTAARIRNDMDNALVSLISPSKQVSYGVFAATLTWDGVGDVDLHVYEPNGAHVYYNSGTGYSGYLDKDNSKAYGPEHYYISCDAAKIQTGVYSVKAANYGRAEGRTAPFRSPLSATAF